MYPSKAHLSHQQRFVGPPPLAHSHGILPSSELLTQSPRTRHPVGVSQAWPALGESQSGRQADRGRAGEGGEVGAATQWGFLEVGTPQESACPGKKVWKRRSRQGLGISEMAASSGLEKEELWAGGGGEEPRAEGLGCVPKGVGFVTGSHRRSLSGST